MSDPALIEECEPKTSAVRHGARAKISTTASSKFASREFRDVGFAISNALRRIVIAEIPYIATFRDEQRPATRAGGFTVRSNTGRLHDDMLVDRLALVPIHLTRAEVLNFIPNSIVIELKASNDTASARNVTSAEISVRLFDKPHPNSRMCYPPCSVTGDHVLISRLYPGESIDVTATLEKSTPYEHAAFAVASSVQIKFALDEDACLLKKKRIAEEASSQVDAERAMNHFDNIGRQREILLNDRGEPALTTLSVVSECGLAGSDVIDFAQEELLRKFTTDNISYDVTSNADGVSYTLHRHGHTFGSVLQEICMRDKEVLGIRTIGYFESHPLENLITVRVSIDSNGRSPTRTMPPDTLFATLLAHCARHLRDLFTRTLYDDCGTKDDGKKNA